MWRRRENIVRRGSGGGEEGLSKVQGGEKGQGKGEQEVSQGPGGARREVSPELGREVERKGEVEFQMHRGDLSLF